MNRFISHKSIFVLLLVWSFVLTLFADSANLDDLCAQTIVLHDDDEVTSPDGQGLLEFQDPPDKTPTLPKSTNNATKSDSSPATPTRVIVDQDSPSLAAERHLDAIFESLYAPESVMAIHQNPPSCDALYLHFCTLLI